MKKKTLGKDDEGNDIDVLIPNDKEEKGMPNIIDGREKKDQTTPPKVGVEMEMVNGKLITNYVCVPCGFKTPNMDEFQKHEKECEKLK